MNAMQPTPALPLHPNIVEMAALLESSNLRSQERSALQRVLHDTVRFVKKRDRRASSCEPVAIQELAEAHA